MRLRKVEVNAEMSYTKNVHLKTACSTFWSEHSVFKYISTINWLCQSFYFRKYSQITFLPDLLKSVLFSMEISSGDRGGVSHCIVIVEEHFFVRQIWSLFLPSLSNRIFVPLQMTTDLCDTLFRVGSPMSRLFLALWCISVSQCFSEGYETIQKHFRIALEQR